MAALVQVQYAVSWTCDRSQQSISTRWHVKWGMESHTAKGLDQVGGEEISFSLPTRSMILEREVSAVQE